MPSTPKAACASSARTTSSVASSAGPTCAICRRSASPSIESTSRRSAIRGSLPMSRRSLTLSALASVSEKVVSNTRASGCRRARCTARCRATIVLPVPADPATRAGPENSRSTIWRWARCKKTVHFSQGKSSARSSSSLSVMTRKRRCASGCAKGSAPAAVCTGTAGVLPVASSSRASAASAGRWSASSSTESSVEAFTSAIHSGGMP